MQKCPKCGNEMRISGHVVRDPNQLAYNCDNCGIDCWVPPKPEKRETKTEDEDKSADSGSTDKLGPSEELKDKKTSTKKKIGRKY